MSNQRQTSPLPENSAEEEEEEEEEVQQQQQEDQKEEEEDKKLQEASQEPKGEGGDERKVATLPPCAQKTSMTRKGPVHKRCAANATNSDPLKQVTRAVYVSLGLPISDDEGDTSPEEERHILCQGLSILLQNLQKPPGGGRGGGGGDERKVTTQKTSIARNGPVRKPYVANLIRADPWKQVTRAVNARRVSNLKAESLQASNKFDSPRQPLGTPAERPFENSAKDGVSQGKEKKRIQDGEDGEGAGEGEGGGEENPRDDSASI